MKFPLALFVLGAGLAVPVAAFGQGAPGPADGPPPGVRAMFEKARADAKAAAYGVLTPAHRDRVTALVAQVAAGTLDRQAAAKQIDDALTPDEQKAVLDAADAARRRMRAMRGDGPPPPGPGGPPPPGAGGPPPGEGSPPGGGAGPGPGGPGGPPWRGPDAGPPSAGRYLVMVSLTREQMRALEPRARSSSAP